MKVDGRDERIDLLRVLGLAMIILAHVNPPELIFHLRNFDVPLMVLISGMSFGLSYKNEAFFAYLWKRIKRLVFPVWVFLSVYFSCIYLFNLDLEKITYEVVIKSFILVGGIGYVWIIKVFLLVALVSPLIYSINKRLKSSAVFLNAIFFIFIFYEILRVYFSDVFSVGIGKQVALISHYIIPYSLVFAIGMRIPLMTKAIIAFCAIISLLVFTLLAAYFWWDKGYVVFTQSHKYPPTIYYFSYAIFMSCIAWLLVGGALSLINRFEVVKRVMMFVAENSIWIYLWHIPLLKLIDANSFVKYIFILSVAVAIASLQVWIVKNIVLRHISHEQSRKNIKMILTG